MIDLLNMTNEEVIEWFRKNVLEVGPDPEFMLRIEEYERNIERDFQVEWAKKKFKWLFTKRRQKKLKYKIYRRYTSPLFWVLEDTLSELCPQEWTEDEYFQEFVDVRDLALGDKDEN